MAVSVKLKFSSMKEALQAAIDINLGASLYVFFLTEKSAWYLTTWDCVSATNPLLQLTIRPNAQPSDIETFLKAVET
jgi:hypothetical protein